MSAESGTSLIPFAEPGWHSLPSPYYKNSHRRLRAATRAFVEEHLMENVFDWEEAGQPDHDKLKEAAKAGMMLPFAFGAHIEEEWVDEKDNRGIIAGIPAKEWDGMFLLETGRFLSLTLKHFHRLSVSRPCCQFIRIH